MIDRILQNSTIYNSDIPQATKDSLCNKVSDYIQQSGLFEVYVRRYMEITKVSPKFQELADNFEDLFAGVGSVLIGSIPMERGGYIASYLLENFIRRSIDTDAYMPFVLYVDTKLLYEDIKKLIDIDKTKDYHTLAHRYEDLTKNIYIADVVIWDRFAVPDTSYSGAKIMEILEIRFKNCKPNVYITPYTKTGLLNDIKLYENAGEVSEALDIGAMYQLTDLKFKVAK